MWVSIANSVVDNPPADISKIHFYDERAIRELCCDLYFSEDHRQLIATTSLPSGNAKQRRKYRREFENTVLEKFPSGIKVQRSYWRPVRQDSPQGGPKFLGKTIEVLDYKGEGSFAQWRQEWGWDFADENLYYNPPTHWRHV